MERRAELSEKSCVSLVGMAGAGKSTLGRLLAERLGWAHMDTDRLVESYWGRDLQSLLDVQGCEAFLKVEEDVVAGLGVRRCVISTGGSVIYGPRAMARLRELGPVVFLRIELATFLERVGPAKNRGFVRRPGCETLQEVFVERQPLYEAAADVVFDTDRATPEESLDMMLRWLA